MAVVRYPIKLNVKPSSYPLIRQVTLVQGDTANIFAIELQESKQPFNIENCHVTATFKKADENVVVLEGNVVDAKNGLVDIPIYSQVVAYPGKVYCTIEVYNMDNLRLTSIMFEFNVIEQLGNDEDIESTTEYTILQSLINEINTINEVEKQRVINENNRITNEDIRLTNETIRVQDEGLRRSEELKRVNEEAIRSVNEKARESAEAIRAQNENNRIIKEDERIQNEINRQIIFNGIVDTANTTKDGLDSSIGAASVIKTALDDSITEGHDLKSDLDAIISGTDYEQIITDVNNLKQDQHNHTNKSTLDGLSDVDGKLKYNGQDVGIGDMAKAEFDVDGDGIIDKANDSNKLGGQLPNYYAQKTYVDTELSKKINTIEKGNANGLAELDSGGKVPASQLPSYVDDVLEYSSLSTFPATGEAGKIYVAIDTNLTYRWSGTAYVEISPSIALGETSSTAYRGDRGKIAYDHSQSTHARIDATKTENSTTNGNIKINGTETNVYTHPETHSTDEVTYQGVTATSMIFNLNSNLQELRNNKVDKLKVATVEKELNDYKNTLAQVNINQEAKQSASGYGVVSLPKNCANGQADVSMRGETLTNLVDNGIDNSNWLGGGFVEKDGITINATSGDVYVENVKLKPNTQYTIILDVVSKDGTADIRMGNDLSGAYWIIASRLGVVKKTFTTKPDLTSTTLTLFCSNVAEGSIKFNDVMILEGDYTNRDVSYVSGTKSTNSAKRATSKDSLGEIKSTAYVVAKKDNKIVNLNSLPNGVADKIRPDGKGGYELVKSVSNEYILKSTDIRGIQTLTNVGIAYTRDEFAPNMTLMTGAVEGKIMILDKQQIDAAYRDNITHIGNYHTTRTVGRQNTIYFIVPKGTALNQAREQLAGTKLFYQLAEPQTIPVEISGNLISHPSGTVYIENAVADTGIYNNGISILEQELDIYYIDKLSKIDYTTGLETEIDVSKTVISDDKKSFTHPDLMDGDMVFFSYFYSNESTEGEVTVEFYDSRYTIKDKSTDKFYKWDIEVDNGVPSIKVVEV